LARKSIECHGAYANLFPRGLHQHLEDQQAASEEVREQFTALVDECRAALRNRGEEND
jgi:hypothetical protein